jgi:uncharacterized protein YrzB (UPF0473 family)
MTENRDEYTPEIISLYEDDGTEVKFEHLDTFELNGVIYIVLLEAEIPDNEDVVIFKVVTDEKGEELFSVIEDDEELEAAYNEFMFRYEDMYFSEDEDEE